MYLHCGRERGQCQVGVLLQTPTRSGVAIFAHPASSQPAVPSFLLSVTRSVSGTHSGSWDLWGGAGEGFMQKGTSELGSKNEQMRLGHSMCKGPGAAGLGWVWKTAGDSGETMTGSRLQAQGGLLTELVVFPGNPQWLSVALSVWTVSVGSRLALSWQQGGWCVSGRWKPTAAVLRLSWDSSLAG